MGRFDLRAEVGQGGQGVHHNRKRVGVAFTLRVFKVGKGSERGGRRC